MAKKIEYGHFLHGGDYNPEQWLDRPDILQKDIEYFKEAHINTVSVGIFSWAVLEPEEGKYNLDWLEQIIDIQRGNLYHPCHTIRCKAKVDGRQIPGSPSHGSGPYQKIFWRQA